MGERWSVKVLRLGEFVVFKEQLTVGKGLGSEIRIPALAYALSSGERKILVDTGVRDLAWMEKTFVPPITTFKGPEEHMEHVLSQQLGWRPEEVDTVIHTHLHFDHCGADHLFRNAIFVLQREEWDFAFQPIAAQDAIYVRSLYDHRSVDYFNWHFAAGEEEVARGIIVFPTPGHTPGHQSILVDTEAGALCITGDICNLTENLIENLLPGISVDNEDVLRSYGEIRKRARYIVPSHDPTIEPFQTDGFPCVGGDWVRV